MWQKLIAMDKGGEDFNENVNVSKDKYSGTLSKS